MQHICPQQSRMNYMTVRQTKFRSQLSRIVIMMKHSVHEEFLSFVNANTGTKTDDLETKFLKSIHLAGIIQQQMCEQGYDGAYNPEHNMCIVVPNLCIIHSLKVRIVCNVMNWDIYGLQETSGVSRATRVQCSSQRRNGKQVKLNTLCDGPITWLPCSVPHTHKLPGLNAARCWSEQMENDMARHRWFTSRSSHQAGYPQSSVLPRDINCPLKILLTYPVYV